MDNNRLKINKLFKEFPKVTKKEWNDKITEDLRCKNFDKTLVWNTYDNLDIDPFYTRDDINKLDYFTNLLPGEYPFTRTCNSYSNNWDICEDIFHEDPSIANKQALEGIESGLSSINFICEVNGREIKGISIQDQSDLSKLIKDINLERIKINYTSGICAKEILSMHINELMKRGLPLDKAHGSLNFDPIRYLQLSGSLQSNQSDYLYQLRSIIEFLSKNMPNFTGLTVNSHQYHNSGASVVQELAFTLASAVEYLDQLTSIGLTVDKITNHMRFSFSIGSSFFMQIAKLRAARSLWSQIVKQFKPENNMCCSMKIDAKVPSWNKTIYDPYVNMLRETTECMAAAIGGCDSITTLPIDFSYKPPDSFSRRLSRNTQLILKYESYLDKVVDPSGGSYYIENLTDMISKEALEIFKQVEKRGGMIESLKSGSIQHDIEQTRQNRDSNIAKTKDIFLGTNHYPNRDERMLDKISEIYKSNKVHISNRKNKINSNTGILELAEFMNTGNIKLGDTINIDNKKSVSITPLIPYRGPSMFESLRFKTENYFKKTGKLPKVFPFPFGDNLAIRNLRATYTANFFGCAGFEIIENPGFDNINDGIASLVDTQPEIVVLCSSDNEYLKTGIDICKMIKNEIPQTHIVVAGYPNDDFKKLKQIGIEGFIYSGSDAVKILSHYQKKLGII